MELLQLQYFCLAAETQSFTRTAEAFQVPVASVSQCIRRLETELGVPLFLRRANRVELSYEGKQFYDSANSALNLLEMGKKGIRSTELNAVLRVAIQSNRTTAREVFCPFRQEFPKVQLSMGRSATRLAFRDCDVIVSSSLPPAEFSYEHVFSDRLRILAAKGLFPEGRPLTAKDLENVDFISMSAGDGIDKHIAKIGNSLGFLPRIVVRVATTSVALSCVAEGVGITILPHWTWKDRVPNETVWHDIEGDFYMEINLCYRGKKHPPIYEKRFIELVRAMYARLPKENI